MDEATQNGVLESSRMVAHLAAEVARHEQELHGLPAGAEHETAIAVAVVVCLLVAALSIGALFCALQDDLHGGEKGGRGSKEPLDSLGSQQHVSRVPRKLEDVLELHRAEGWSALRHFIVRMQSSEEDRRSFNNLLPRVTAKLFGLEGHGWQKDVLAPPDRRALLELLMPPLPSAHALSAPSPSERGAAALGSPQLGAARTPAGRTPATVARGGAAALGSAARAPGLDAERSAVKGDGAPGAPGGAGGWAGAGAVFAQLFTPRHMSAQQALRFSFFARKLPAAMHAAIEHRQWHALPPLIRAKLEQAAQAAGAQQPQAQPQPSAGSADAAGGALGGFGSPAPARGGAGAASAALAAAPTILTLSVSEYFLFHFCLCATENAGAFYQEACYSAPYSIVPTDREARASGEATSAAGSGGARRRRPVSLYVQLLRAYLDFFLPTAATRGGGDAGAQAGVAGPAGGAVGADHRAALGAGTPYGGARGAHSPAAALAYGGGSDPPAEEPEAPAVRRQLHGLFLEVATAFWLYAGVADERRYASPGAASVATYAEPPVQLVQCVEILVDHVALGLSAGVDAHAASRAGAFAPPPLGPRLYQLGLGAAVAGALSPYELLSDRVYHFCLTSLARLPRGSRRYARVVAIWLAFACPWSGFVASRDLGGGIGGELNEGGRARSGARSTSGGRADGGAHAEAAELGGARRGGPEGRAGGGGGAELDGPAAAHWREFLAGHWLLILRPLIFILADRAGQLDLATADALDTLAAILSACSHPTLLRTLAAVSDGVLARAVGAGRAGGGSLSRAGAGAPVAPPASAYELELACKFAHCLEGLGWPTAARAAHHAQLSAAANGLLERLERKAHELRTQQRARGVAGRVMHDVVGSIHASGLSASQGAAHLARLGAVQSQLELLISTLNPAAAAARARGADGGGAGGAGGAARSLHAPAMREPHSGALTPAGKALLAAGGARADAASVRFRATPTTPRRPIASSEMGPLVLLAERAGELLRGRVRGLLARSLAPELARSASAAIDAVQLRALASKRVVGLCAGLGAVLCAAPPEGAQRWVTWLWRLVVLWLGAVLGIVCQVAGVLVFPSPSGARSGGAEAAPGSAQPGVDTGRWVAWARAELARGAERDEIERRVTDELGAVVGVGAATDAASDIVARAVAADLGRRSNADPAGDALSVARRMAF